MADDGWAEAERLRSEVERLAAENADLRAQVAALSEKVATLTKLVFGASSEKKNAYSGPSRSLIPRQADH